MLQVTINSFKCRHLIQGYLGIILPPNFTNCVAEFGKICRGKTGALFISFATLSCKVLITEKKLYVHCEKTGPIPVVCQEETAVLH